MDGFLGEKKSYMRAIDLRRNILRSFGPLEARILSFQNRQRTTHKMQTSRDEDLEALVFLPNIRDSLFYRRRDDDFCPGIECPPDVGEGVLKS
jgi:hypothetical protein